MLFEISVVLGGPIVTVFGLLKLLVFTVMVPTLEDATVVVTEGRVAVDVPGTFWLII